MSSDSESDFAPVTKKKTSAPAKKATSAPAKKAPSSAAKKTTTAAPKKKAAKMRDSSDDDKGDDDDDDDRDDDDDDDEPIAPKKKGGKKNVEDIYKKTNLREHILNRPDSYIGTIEQETDKIFVVNDEGDKFVQKNITYVPGLLKIFDEILVNAADNKQRDPRGMNELRVDVDKARNRISVYNNGKGIPIEIHKEYNIYVAELIFGQLLTSSNYDDDEKRTVGGRNGFGAKLANIFSKQFVVETCDGRKYYKQVFTKNMSDKSEPEIGPPPGGKGESFTRVTFIPDLGRFGMTELEDDIIALLRRRTYDIAGTSGKGLKVYYNGKSLGIKDFKQFCEMHLDTPSDLMFETINDRWEVAIAPSDQFTQVSFVNRISTLRGGTHVNVIVDQVAKTLADVVGKKSKKVQLKPQHIKQHLWVFVNALVENPTFDTQTKVNLTSKKTTFGSSPDLSDAFSKKVAKSAIVSAILSFAQFQADKELKKNDAKKKTSRLLGIPKLEDANMAGTRNSDKCTLIITEGDSAKALAMSGLSVVGRDHFGVFPIRGKLLNVRDATTKQILENAEITFLKQIIGLQQGKNYTDVSSLRYGHIMIMTDQDHDGSHIKGLIINLFATFWPSLLKMPGFLTEFITPIVKVSKGKTASTQRGAVTFYTLPEYDEWLEETNNGKGWNVKYYKGLGTSSSAEAKVYFTNIDTHQIPFKYKDDKCTKLIEMLFSKATADERKNWLTTYVPGTYLNHAVSQIYYQDFINKELILFSIASNQRAIPSIMDGLKPGQRKILFACFKRNLKKELKVAQLAGYVAEQSAYHHGEVSLAGTIVTLAQNFVGSNNINYLWPSGQFGTRAGGGKDAASARYIFTYLSPVTRTLFHPSDDPLLNYLSDDNQPIEPDFYVPILPTVLINGSSGIGTGWSSDIYNHNPRDLIENIRKMLNNEEPEEMHPWYKNFIGEVSQRQGKRGTYFVRGLFDVIAERACTVHVYELPIGDWTSNYKANLEEMSKKGEVVELSEYHTDITVSFLITFSESVWDKAISGPGGLENSLKSFLKLESSMSSSNMVLFNKDGKLHRYDTTLEILKEFFPVRLELYKTRKQFLIDTISAELRKIDNKVRFIQYVIEEKIKMRNIKRADLLKVLRDYKFDPLLSEKATQPASLRNTVPGADDDDDDDDEQDGIPTAGKSKKSAAPVDSVSEGLRGYAYLTSMPLLSLTYEKVQELLNEKSGKESELKVIQSRSAQTMWRTDLDAFEIALDGHEEQELAELRAGENAKYGAGGLRGTAKKGAKGKKMGDSDDDFSDGGESDDDWGGAKKKKKPVAKKGAAKDKKLNIPDFILTKMQNRPTEQTFSVDEETELEKKRRLKQEANAAAKLSDVADLLGLTDFMDQRPTTTPKSTKKTAGTKKATKTLDDDSENEDPKPKRQARTAPSEKAAAGTKGGNSKKKQSLDSEDDFFGETSSDSATESGFDDFGSGDDDNDDDGDDGSNSDSGSESGSDSGSDDDDDDDDDHVVVKKAQPSQSSNAAPRGPTKRKIIESGSSSSDDSGSERDIKSKKKPVATKTTSSGTKKQRNSEYDQDDSDDDNIVLKPKTSLKKTVIGDDSDGDDFKPSKLSKSSSQKTSTTTTKPSKKDPEPTPGPKSDFAAALLAKSTASGATTSAQRSILDMIGTTHPSAGASSSVAATKPKFMSISSDDESDDDNDFFQAPASKVSKPPSAASKPSAAPFSAGSSLKNRFMAYSDDDDDDDDFRSMNQKPAVATTSSFLNKPSSAAPVKSKFSMYDSDSD